MGLSFNQFRKLRECHEYKYARDAAYSLKQSDPESLYLMNEVTHDHGHISGTVTRLDSKAGHKCKIEGETKKVRWADKVEEVAMKRHRVDSSTWTDVTRQA